MLFPLYYISAMHAHLLPIMLVGGTCVLVSSVTPAQFVTVLADHAITWAYAVPSFWLMLLRVPEFGWPALADLTVGVFGGAPFPLSALPELRRRMPQTRWHDIYGLSETHSPATMLMDEEFRRKPGSVGRPLPCMEAEVVDEVGRAARLPARPASCGSGARW